jgi:formylglycine-generating enzyme required for sulfatase activity
MVRCVDQIGQSFEFDVLAAKVALLAGFAEKSADAARIQSVLELAEPLFEEALADERIELARALSAGLAHLVACPAAKPFRTQIRQWREEVERLSRQWAELQQARETLKEKPDDAAASEVVGQWLCLFKSDWQAGLPYLVKSFDPALKALAEQEGRRPTSSDARLKLADGWWDYAKRAKPSLHGAALMRAGDWYRQVEPDVKNETRRKQVDKRLDEISRLTRPANGRRQPEPFVNSIGMKLVPIPTGEFQMGSTPEDIAWCVQYLKTHYKPGSHERLSKKFEREGPSRTVRIDLLFYLGVYEVTQGQYEKVRAGSPGQSGAGPAAGAQSEELPVGSVSWLDAVEFCNRLSEMPAERAARREYRLPTEAEWEYACRAGTTGRGPPMSRFWYASNSSGASHPVGSKGPNAWQLCDMLGNVSEWCLNRADEDYFRQMPISTDT